MINLLIESPNPQKSLQEDSMNTAQSLMLILFFYEYIVWHFEIPGLCSHHKHATSHNSYMMSATINSGIHLIGYFAFRSSRWIPRLIYILVLSFFTFMQFMFWWFPYFGLTSMSIFHKKEGGLELYQKNFGGSVRIIPRGWSEVHPGLEHTILLPLSVLTLLCAIRQFVAGISKRKHV
jgi:hypothetical protein